VSPGVAADRLVSVIIPTYHRPELVRKAVASVLDQRLPSPWACEVVVAVSDATSAEDRDVAEALAGGDPRVRVATAARLGPGAARNAGIDAARGEALAFMDDDCEAHAGWLAAGVARLDEVELVQGRTLPAEPASHSYSRTICVLSESQLWESCNLFVRRSTVERCGAFDADWNPTGQPGNHWGEDTEWGWRLVRGGASHAFEPDAVVYHAVFRPGFREWFRYEAKLRYFPVLVDRIPELRDAYLVDGHFLMRRHRTMTAGLALLAAAGAAKLAGHPRAARAAALLAAVPLSSGHVRATLPYVAKEWIDYGACVYGSIRYGRVVL
jgi:glycosyltransferase involved in cell wall biosynthesis